MFAPAPAECTPGEEHCACSCHRVPGVYHCVPCCYPLPENLLEVSTHEFPISSPQLPSPGVVHSPEKAPGEIPPGG